MRKLDGLACGPVVIADTVGFVRDLPHDLVAAFRSTLSEARDADLLLHVVDASDPLRDERIEQVDAVLKEIGAGDLPQLLVYNKIDRLEDTAPRIDELEGGERTRAWVSAREGTGMDGLRAAISARFESERIHRHVRLPAIAGRLRARLFEAGAVVAESSDDDGWNMELDLPLVLAEQLCAGPDAEAAALRGQLLAAS